MNYESPQFNNEPLQDKELKQEKVPDLNEDNNEEVIELNLTAEDFMKLENLRDKIDQIQNSSFERQQKFIEATEDFLNKLDEIYEEGELIEIAAISFLKGEGISRDATHFD
jgi:hypothetical protein